MANNPFDPPIVQIKKTLERGGLAGANKGFGSARIMGIAPRAAPGVQNLAELNDVSDAAPADGDQLTYDAASDLWIPGTAGGGGGGGGTPGALFALYISPPIGITTSSQSATVVNGEIVQPLTDLTVTNVKVQMTTVVGKTYKLRLYEVAANRNTLSSAALYSATVASPGAATGLVDFGTLAWNMDSGKIYALAVSVTDATNPTVFAGGSLAQGVPGMLMCRPPAMNGRFTCAVADPVSGSTISTASTDLEFRAIAKNR